MVLTVEACPLLARQIKSIEFTLTRIFMKLFRTASPITVNECQVNFGFLPAKYQILISTAKFLQRFVALENGLCVLFASDARRQLEGIFTQFVKGVYTTCQLHNAVCCQFFNNV